MVNKSIKLIKRKTKRKTKNVTRGWANLSPNTHERTIMLNKCGNGCFLGPNKSFPICAKGTCKVNPKGLYSAYIRAKQWGKSRKLYKTSKPTHTRKTYKNIADKSKRILSRAFGYNRVGINSIRN